MNRKIGQRLAIDFDSSLLQARHHPAVGQLEHPGRSVDPLDPQRAIVPLLQPAADVSVLPGLYDGLLRDAVDLAPGVLIALCLGQDLLVAASSNDAPFDSCHVVILLSDSVRDWEAAS